MNPELWTFETWQLIAGAAVLTLVVALIIWAVMRRSYRSGRGRHLNEQQRYEALTRGHDGLSEKYTLLAERVDRLDRGQHEMHDEFAALRDDLTRRSETLESPQKAHKELQDQIFELREEVKVLLQRDDRHERTLQELQGELNHLRRELKVPAA